MPNLIEIRPVVLEKKMKMWKVNDNNNDNNNWQILIKKAHLNLQLRVANKIKAPRRITNNLYKQFP